MKNFWALVYIYIFSIHRILSLFSFVHFFLFGSFHSSWFFLEQKSLLMWQYLFFSRVTFGPSSCPLDLLDLDFFLKKVFTVRFARLQQKMLPEDKYAKRRQLSILSKWRWRVDQFIALVWFYFVSRNLHAESCEHAKIMIHELSWAR